MKIRFIVSPLLSDSFDVSLYVPMLQGNFACRYPSAILQYFHGTENAAVFALTQLLLLLPIVFINFGYFTRGFRSLFRVFRIWTA